MKEKREISGIAVNQVNREVLERKELRAVQAISVHEEIEDGRAPQELMVNRAERDEEGRGVHQEHLDQEEEQERREIRAQEGELGALELLACAEERDLEGVVDQEVFRVTLDQRVLKVRGAIPVQLA